MDPWRAAFSKFAAGSQIRGAAEGEAAGGGGAAGGAKVAIGGIPDGKRVARTRQLSLHSTRQKVRTREMGGNDHVTVLCSVCVWWMLPLTLLAHSGKKKSQ